ncbi:MAG: hypothetical protein R2794_02445 [Chitinophagales bacterium]
MTKKDLKIEIFDQNLLNSKESKTEFYDGLVNERFSTDESGGLPVIPAPRRQIRQLGIYQTPAEHPVLPRQQPTHLL